VPLVLLSNSARSRHRWFPCFRGSTSSQLPAISEATLVKGYRAVDEDLHILVDQPGPDVVD